VVARATKPALPQLFLILMLYALILVIPDFLLRLQLENTDVFKQENILDCIGVFLG
jgi:hypothetical protein